MSLSSSDVLFVGKGLGAVSWYRTGLPSFTLGCDWVAVIGTPPKLKMVGGLKRGGLVMPEFSDYRVVIIQQPRGQKWARLISDLKRAGIVVLVEIDDYIHAIPEMTSHRWHKHFDKKFIRGHEKCMEAASGLIVSTEFLAERYRRFNEQVFVCENGVMARRYSEFLLPARETINIGWAGGAGHEESCMAWLAAINRIMGEHPEARFYSVGLPLAEYVADRDRSIALPFVQVENFPAALCNFDIALGPAGGSDFFRAKSDLRWLETGALGIPLIGDPRVYSGIDPLVTGLYAATSQEAYEAMKLLITDKQLRQSIGENARVKAQERDIERTAQKWVDIFFEAAL